MYMMYVDESGDVGLINSPTRYFCLSGLVVHESKWDELLELIIDFRRYIRAQYSFKLREEIHSSHFLHKPGELSRIPKSMRLRLLRDIIDFEAELKEIIRIINVVVDKDSKAENSDIFEIAWTTLIQRFENTINYKNFVGSNNDSDTGMLFVDQTDEVKLRSLARRMRKYNPIPNSMGGGYRMKPTKWIIEDAVHQNSLHSYIIQLCDVNAYFLNQMMQPCSYVKKKGGRNYFQRLLPILSTQASRNNAFGIVTR